MPSPTYSKIAQLVYIQSVFETNTNLTQKMRTEIMDKLGNQFVLFLLTRQTSIFLLVSFLG